jgi:bile acid:Na+ symporter, BASS family
MQSLKKYSFSLLIFAAAALALIHPSLFTSLGGFPLKLLIIPITQVIMFGMGTGMSMGDFSLVLKRPRAVIIGLLCQFTIMPFLGYTLAKSFGFSGEIAAGVILIGCSPSGLASNVMCYIAKANVALSITITSLATVLAPFLTPFLMKMLANEYIEIDLLQMMVDVAKLIFIPLALGFLVNKLLQIRKPLYTLLSSIILLGIGVLPSIFTGKGLALNIDLLIFIVVGIILLIFLLFSFSPENIDKILPKISMGGIVLIIAIIVAAGRDAILEKGGLLLLSTLLHNCLGYFLGYNAARLLKLPEADRRTVAIEVGLQNGGLASAIAMKMGKIATVGLAPALFGPIMNITGSMLATFWGKKDSNAK